MFLQYSTADHVYYICFICYLGASKTRRRGCLKGYKAAAKRIKSGSQKLKIEFDPLLGGPYGENSRTFVDEIVVFTRKKAPLIGVQSWKDVQDIVKISIANEMQVSLVFSRAKIMNLVPPLDSVICLAIQNRMSGI